MEKSILFENIRAVARAAQVLDGDLERLSRSLDSTERKAEISNELALAVMTSLHRHLGAASPAAERTALEAVERLTGGGF
jgi:hypothetical protein